MSFRYVIETLNKNGSKETSVQEIDKNEILIGRGTSSDILLLGRLVSLNHALVTVGEGTLSIQDQESLSGVSVNDTLISKTALKPGDRVKIGTYVFIVFNEGGWGFYEKRADTGEEQETEVIVRQQERKLRFQSYIPSLSVLSYLLLASVLAWYFLAPMTIQRNVRSWNSGPISNAHKMIENNCAQCHATGFVRVQDEQCLACHSMSEHAPSLSGVLEKHPNLEKRCAECHMEHNGDAGIIASSSKLCTDCHRSITNYVGTDGTPNVASFANHPEFRVTVPAEDGSWKKVRLDDKSFKDATAIKLNHKIHLEPDIAGRDGLVTLTCASCHQFDRELRDMRPITYEAHCADCHSLEFDERLPGAAVPHGEPKVVYNYLYAEYAKLFLEKEGVEEEQANDRRRKPGQAVKRGVEITFTRQSVVEQVRKTEEEMFTRTACHLCHFIEELPEVSTGDSRFLVNKPKIPSKWMPESTFDHGAHQEVACESCHVGVSKSEKTTDVLLPGKENCYQCHDQAGSLGMVKSDCITCHSYHDTLILDEEKKREIENILMSLGGNAGKKLS